MLRTEWFSVELPYNSYGNIKHDTWLILWMYKSFMYLKYLKKRYWTNTPPCLLPPFLSSLGWSPHPCLLDILYAPVQRTVWSPLGHVGLTASLMFLLRVWLWVPCLPWASGTPPLSLQCGCLQGESHDHDDCGVDSTRELVVLWLLWLQECSLTWNGQNCQWLRQFSFFISQRTTYLHLLSASFPRYNS